MIIEGRRTYDMEVHQGWESAHPVPTFVLSHRPPERAPKREDVVFTAEDIAEVLKKAKQLTNKNMWIVGGADVALQFLERGLIDELVLSIVPVILGDGIRLFGKALTSIELSLREAKQLDKGLVQLTYTRECCVDSCLRLQTANVHPSSYHLSRYT